MHIFTAECQRKWGQRDGSDYACQGDLSTGLSCLSWSEWRRQDRDTAGPRVKPAGLDGSEGPDRARRSTVVQHNPFWTRTDAGGEHGTRGRWRGTGFDSVHSGPGKR